jgi:nucleoside phosphorylase
VRGLVCAATRSELDACRRGIRAATGDAFDTSARFEMLLTGVGPARAARALGQRLANGPAPDLVVSSGFAGALSPTLALSSWVTGARVSEWSASESAAVEVAGLVLVCALGLERCDVISSSTLVVPGTRSLPAARPAPLVVDMESAALAREARRRGVPFAVARLVSDTPAHPMPAFMAPFAAALAGETAASRLIAAGRGVCAAAAAPRAVARFVRESSTWLRDLEDGWARLGTAGAWRSALRT